MRPLFVGRVWFRGSQALALAVVIVTASGCGKILGVDEYAVAEPCPAGTEHGRDGHCHVIAGCLPLEVRDQAGKCVAVGVSPDRCRDGLEPDSKGGCRAVMRHSECSDAWGVLVPGFDCATGLACTDGDFPPAPAGASPLVYVRGDAEASGDGTARDRPLRTIAAALDLAGDGSAILVYPGTYSEDVVINRSNVHLVGCISNVILKGLGEPWDVSYPCAQSGPGSKAAICVAPSVRGVRIDGFSVTGPAEGLAVVGADAIVNAAINDTGRYGVRVEEGRDGKVPASLTLSVSVIGGAGGAGVFVAGAHLVLDRVSVHDTRPLVDGGWARGVSVYPSGEYSSYLVPENGTPKTTRSTVEIRQSRISGNPEVGIWLSGVESAVIERTFVGSADDSRHAGLGILVEEGIPSGAPATDVTIDRAVIERASDAGVDVHDATVKIVDTTIRDTYPRDSDGCSGQGVRVRSDPGKTADATIVSSLVDESRQAAVHDLGSKVTIQRTILRGSSPKGVPSKCSAAFGDGITVESVRELQASASLEECLVTGNARAGISSAWAHVEATSTVLDCNRRGIVQEGESLPPGGAACGCGADHEICLVDHGLLPSWLAFPSEGIWADSTKPLEMCTTDTVSNVGPLSSTRAWVVGRPEIPAALSSADGCWRLDGYPASGDVVRSVWDPKYSVATVTVPGGSPGGSVFGMGLQFGSIAQPMWDVPDLNKAFLWINVPAGFRVRTDRAAVVYLSGYARPDPPLAASSPPFYQAVATNLDPGWLTVTLEPPAGTVCAMTSTSGVPAPGGPLTVRTMLEPGSVNNVALRCQ